MKNFYKQTKIKVAHPQIKQNHHNNFYKICPFIGLPPGVIFEQFLVQISSP